MKTYRRCTLCAVVLLVAASTVVAHAESSQEPEPAPAEGVVFAVAALPDLPADGECDQLFTPVPAGEGIGAMSCTATWYCETGYGSMISCHCPGAGTCTSGPASHGFVSCDCTPDPDYYYSCPCISCTSDSICRKPFACNNPWAICYQGCCLCD